MPTEITTALIGIVAALLGGWAGAAISRKSAKDILKKEQFYSAVSKFRASVIYELIGFYPINQHWEKKDFHRLYSSIAKVNSAAAEFRYFVNHKTDFDNAITKYSKYCRETKYESIAADTMYPKMRGKSEIDKREQFSHIVEYLLSFADDK